MPAAPIEAEALVPAAPEDVFEFLVPLGNHWRIADPFIEVLELDEGGRGGRVRLHGPLGVRRTARTSVTAVHSPRLIIGTAELPGGTRARVSWTLADRLGSTRVRLAAEVEHARGPDRLLLALGGRLWLRRRFARTLERLAERFEPAAAPAG